MLVAVDRHDAEDSARQSASGEVSGGEVIGFYCPVCGHLLTAQDRQPASAPTCTGSKARTGKQHEPTHMRTLPFD
jgi:hypothetical protein